jgi:hypothetical protein
MNDKRYDPTKTLHNVDPRPAMVWVERGLVQDSYQTLRTLLDTDPTPEQAQAGLDQFRANLDACLETVQARLPDIPIRYRTLDGDFEALRRNLPRVTQNPHEAMQVGLFVALCGMNGLYGLATLAADRPRPRLGRLVFNLARMLDNLDEVWRREAERLLKRRPDLPQLAERVVLTRDESSGAISFVLDLP